MHKPRTRRLSFTFLFLLSLVSSPLMAVAETHGAPDILVLGDSQLSFGSGVAFVEVLSGLAGQCGIKKDATVGVIGVRSSSVQSWTGTTKRAKGAICNVDPKWRVNAGVYGTLSQGKNPYVQIGKGEQFQLCVPNLSPLKAVFDHGYYNPDLVIFFLMGNAAERWAGSYDAALADVRAFVGDLPRMQPCIFMTSAPPYDKKIVALRQRAQDNVERAFVAQGKTCSFVPGFTAQTIAANQGNKQHFRRKPSGAVKDGFHPTEQAARIFLKLRKDALCTAIRQQLTGNVLAPQSQDRDVAGDAVTPKANDANSSAHKP
jgi:hypothetical protein